LTEINRANAAGLCPSLPPGLPGSRGRHIKGIGANSERQRIEPSFRVAVDATNAARVPV